jgi:hypothetical protein
MRFDIVRAGNRVAEDSTPYDRLERIGLRALARLVWKNVV